jgi:organic radical activating enzyme
MPETEKPIPRTSFGEEIPPVKVFSFNITSRCNMNCNFCFQHGREYNAGKDMTFEEFKYIVDQIASSTHEGVSKHICIGGGEPLLNKDLEKMSNYATRVLGRNNVSITTNLALFPITVPQVAALIQRLGSPVFNVSLDREHLRYGKEMEERVSAFFAAVRQLGVTAHVQNVAQTKYQEKHRWPRNIARLIPKEVREEVAKFNSYGRREFYSHRRAVKDMREYLAKLRKGKHVAVPPFNVVLSMGLAPAPGMKIPIEIHFSVDGKAYLFSGLGAFHAPQLSLGSWRRETLAEITQTNLPYKLNMLKHWFGMIRIGNREKNARFNFIDRDNPRKAKAFGKYATRRFKAQKKVMKNRFKR